MRFPGILTDHYNNARTHDSPVKIRLIKSNKPITSVDYVRENDQTTERDLFPDIIGRHPVLLAPVGAHKELHSGRGKLQEAPIVEVQYTHINQIQIHVHV